MLNLAKNVFQIEAFEISNIAKKLSSDFEETIRAILKSSGKVVVTGIGKSGIIGKKISATLSSTGTPSFFLHPAEAYHGDLGMVERDDIVLLISNSGETDEVLRILPFFKSQGNITIAITGNPQSTLAKNSDYHLDIGVSQEACPLQLAPTSSTTATLVMGDALAVVLMQLRNFQPKDFAQFHPGGNLGKRLVTKVGDVMRKENLPICNPDTDMKSVIHKVTAGKLGLVIVMKQDTIVGIITDGDLRRAMERSEDQFFKLRAKDIMTTNPKVIDKDSKLVEANRIMEENKINSLLVVNRNRLVGVIQLYDI
ncbi:MAG TPA: KpsF/GutQ family sugar-phosphate isomerase [Campylobacterales bacterium]|nr:KpsF/GutQ family sugar-phosphate isomerase [Campylobacterales bacterium]